MCRSCFSPSIHPLSRGIKLRSPHLKTGTLPAQPSLYPFLFYLSIFNFFMHFLLPTPTLPFLNFINNNKDGAEPSGSHTGGNTSDSFSMVTFSLTFSLWAVQSIHCGDGVKGSHDELSHNSSRPREHPEERPCRAWKHRDCYSNSPSWLEEAFLIYSTVSPDDHRQNTSMTALPTPSLQKAAGSFHSEPLLLTYQTELQID